MRDQGATDRPARRRPRLPTQLQFAGAIAAVVVAAFVLRLWGLRHGLPYVFSADENAHFVPRAIGMFGHSLNPQYFVNPPAFTYLLHAAFWVRWGSREAVGGAFAADPGRRSRSRACSSRCSARPPPG